MKNIGASVSEVLTQEKKEAEVEKQIEVEEVEEEECIHMENEVVFFLKEAPEYRISGVAEWGENARGDVVREVDTYFRHILTGRLCQSIYACLGDEVYDQFVEEKWETLAFRLRMMLRRDLRRIVCGEKKYEIHPI